MVSIGTEQIFDPSSIAGLSLWLKPESITVGDGNPVAVWPDSSQGGNSAKQPTLANQPIFRLSTGPNGKSCVQFDGVNDFLRFDNFGPPVNGTLTQPFTILAVYDIGRTFDFQIGVRSLFNPTPGVAGIWASASLNASPTVNLVAETFIVQTGVYNGGSSKVRVNGVETTGNPGGNNLQGMTLMTDTANGVTGNFSAGKISELLVYNSALSPENILNVEGYLKTRYGL